MARIQVEDLRKEFGAGDERVVAVEDVSLDIADGEFLVLVGPSGCGKTTTLRCIAGLEDVSDGSIRFDDIDAPTGGRASATSRWCFRTTRCTHIWTSGGTSGSG